MLQALVRFWEFDGVGEVAFRMCFPAKASAAPKVVVEEDALPGLPEVVLFLLFSFSPEWKEGFFESCVLSPSKWQVGQAVTLAGVERTPLSRRCEMCWTGDNYCSGTAGEQQPSWAWSWGLNRGWVNLSSGGGWQRKSKLTCHKDLQNIIFLFSVQLGGGGGDVFLFVCLCFWSVFFVCVLLGFVFFVVELWLCFLCVFVCFLALCV